MSLPITLLFFTTSKGHFERRDIFSKTLKDWNDNSFLNLFEYKLAHIKDGGERSIEEMVKKINNYWFDKVLVTPGSFQHFKPNHSIGQLQDIGKLINEVADDSDFIMMAEDDWLLRPKTDSLENFLIEAMELLEENENVSQVRVPRHLDDKNHYKTLCKPEQYKHEDYFRQNDIYSFNPHIARKKDLQIISNSISAQSDLIVDYINKGVLNSELTFTQFARQLRGDYSFWSFDSKDIQCYHRGTPEGEEDKTPEELL